MPRYERLAQDTGSEPWSLTELPPELGGAEAPTLDGPPRVLRADGASPGSLMIARRGAGSAATTDLVVSPELAAVLRAFALPHHVAVSCTVEREALDLRRMRMRKRTGPALPYVWLWWDETFGRRVDFTRSTFFLRYRSGETAEAAYDCLEDFEQVVRRAVNTLELDIAPANLEWSDEAVYGLDLIPLGVDVFLSPALAEALRQARLPGLRVLPARTTATVIA